MPNCPPAPPGHAQDVMLSAHTHTCAHTVFCASVNEGNTKYSLLFKVSLENFSEPLLTQGSLVDLQKEDIECSVLKTHVSQNTYSNFPEEYSLDHSLRSLGGEGGVHPRCARYHPSLLYKVS